MPPLSINLGQRLWDMAEEMFERALRGDPPLVSSSEPEPEPPSAPFTGEVLAAGVQYPAGEPDGRRAVKVFRLREDGTSEDALLTCGDGGLLFSQTEAARLVRHIGGNLALPEGMAYIPEPGDWWRGLEDRPFYDYLPDCGDSVDVVPSPVHYRNHVTAGETPCAVAAADMEEWEKYVRCSAGCGLECDCDLLPWSWDEYRGDVPLADRPHRVYRIRFPQGGGVEDWYYGITSKILAARIFGHNSEVGARRNSGETYTAETLCVMKNRKTAAVAERELIRAGNPTGGRLINKTHRRGR